MNTITFSLHDRAYREVDYHGYARVAVDPSETAIGSRVWFPMACGTAEATVAYVGITVDGELKELVRLGDGMGMNVCCGVSVGVNLPNEVLKRYGMHEQSLWWVPWRMGPGGRIVRAVSAREANAVSGIYGGQAPWEITPDDALKRARHYEVLAPAFTTEGSAAVLAEFGRDEHEPPELDSSPGSY